METFLINAAIGALSVIIFGPIIWLRQNRKRRKEEERQQRDKEETKRYNETLRQDEEVWVREFNETHPTPTNSP